MAFIGIYRAVYDYAPQSGEELAIKEGDLLFVLEKSTEDAWWKAKKKAATDEEDEPEGLIPNNYIEEAKPTHQARALYDYSKQTDEEISFREDARLDVYDGTDPDWTLVGFEGEYGFAPAIYIEPVSAERIASTPAAATAATPAAEPAAPPMPPRPAAPADDGPIPGEADYPGPGHSHAPERAANNPAAALAGIIAQKTGPSEAATPAPVAPPPTQRAVASPPSRPQYTPEESEEEDVPPPSLPNRHQSQLPRPIDVSAPLPPDPPGVQASPPYNRAVATNGRHREDDAPLASPGGFHLYNIYEMVSHMGKNKKMPTTLGINVGKGLISITPESRNDGPSYEWTADKLTHYSIEGKHVFVELVRPSKSVDFHAGAKDTAKEIVSQLGELAGAVRQEGLREVIAAASAGTGAGGYKKGQMLYEFKAQSADEVTVAVGDEVFVLDDAASEEWWRVRRLRNGKEGVVPSSYVEITGRVERGSDNVTGLNSARSTVEQNRLEEERLARESSKGGAKRRESPANPAVSLPERGSSLSGEAKKSSQREKTAAKDQPPRSKPNEARVRTWTDRSATFKVEAEFIGLRDGKIHLHKMNGVKIAVPVSKMAVEDLEYVERATGRSLDDDKPLNEIKRRATLKKEKEARNGAGASIQKKEEYDWFEFFLQCGVNPQICERYASAFSRDQMGPEILPDVNEPLLRTLGLKEGDILRVLKHLDTKFDRKKNEQAGAEGANGGLFTDATGALRNNTRKGRPAPPVQTNDIIDDDAFRAKSPDGPEGAKATPLTGAPAPPTKNGFDDDAWNVKPARSQPATAAAAVAASSPVAATPPPPAPEPPKPHVNNDIALLSQTNPPLQPTQIPATAPVAAPAAQPEPRHVPQQPQGADQAIFDKIAALAPQQTAAARQRPAPPAQQGTGSLPPPPRASSAPGFSQQQNFGAPMPLQPNYTGFQPQSQVAPPGHSLQDLQMQQRMQQQGLMPQITGFPGQQQAFTGFPQQLNGTGFAPQQTGIPSIQQNYPALQPTPTGFIPQSQFGQAAYGGQLPNTQQALVNGAATGSPFADPTPRQYTPAQPSGLANSFTAQQTGFPGQQQQQPSFSINQPTGYNGFGAQPTQGPAPQLPPQQTGGVFGPSQPITPLVPQQTGPPPPVRFGVQQGAKPLLSQRTGRAELSRATPQNPFGF